MWKWISQEANAIVAVATVAGIFVTVAGFGLTICQLRQATNQLQASNEYAIRKDLRELVQEIAPKMRIVCLAASTTCEQHEVIEAKQSLGLLFNFYQSVYRQAEASGISPIFKAQMADDFCQSFERPEVLAFWDAQVAAQQYKDERIKMRSAWCPGKASRK